LVTGVQTCAFRSDRGAGRSTLFPAHGGGQFARRRKQGQGEARLEAGDRFQGPGRGDGARGPGAGRARSARARPRPQDLRLPRRAGVKQDSKIYVAGHRGLAGSALVRGLQARGYRNLVTRTHAELDLIDQRAVREFFQRERPGVVFLAAAKVGGIAANQSYPADFIFQNLAIQTNVLQEAWKAGVRDLLFLGTACIYPRDCPQPIKEEYLLTGRSSRPTARTPRRRSPASGLGWRSIPKSARPTPGP